MSTENMRGEFERWWVSNNAGFHPCSTWEELRGVDGYSDEEIDMQWEAWKASRAALVIEWPKPSTELIGGDYQRGMVAGEIKRWQWCVWSARRAGITVRDAV